MHRRSLCAALGPLALLAGACGRPVDLGAVSTEAQALGGISLVQVGSVSFKGSQGPQSVAVLPFALPQGAGDTTLVAIGWDDVTALIQSVSDSNGNAYVVAMPLLRSDGGAQTSLSQALYLANGIDAGPNTLTVTLNQPAISIDVRAAEYSGVDPLAPIDAKLAGADAGNGLASIGSITTHAPNEMIVVADLSAWLADAGPGYTKIIATQVGDIVEQKLAGPAGSYPVQAWNTPNGTSNTGWLLQAVALQPASAPDGGAAPRAQIDPQDQTVFSGATVALDGSGSSAAPGSTLAAYQWSQPAGPSGVRLGAGPSQHFTAVAPGAYRFQLVVVDTSGTASPPAFATVEVQARACGCGAGTAAPLAALAWALWLARAAISARRRRSGRSPLRGPPGPDGSSSRS